MNVGFIGTGVMGEPIARRLLSAGTPLQVWNRTPARCESLRPLGATVADSPAQVLQRCDVVLLMLANAGAIDSTLARDSIDFGPGLRGRTLVNLGTCAPAFSSGLARDLEAAGGRYVEAPVSGSRVQAEQGRLLAMLAGDVEGMDFASALLAPAISQSFRCGATPSAMRLKLAVNHYLIVMVAALAETVNVARAGGLDLQLLREVLDAGPMASEVSRIKLHKLVSGDLSAQAAIGDVRTIAELALEAAREAGMECPLMTAAAALYREADEAGRSRLDMIAVGAQAA